MQTNRYVILDTETTGMNQSGGPVYIGHRIIEIGCVEVINRRLTGNHYHVYIKPDRLVDEEAIRFMVLPMLSLRINRRLRLSHKNSGILFAVRN